MCKKKNYHGTSNTQIDKCMLNLIGTLSQVPNFKVLACCCGHKKYPMTIIYKDKFSENINELMSGKLIPRKRNFYKKDKEGYYYIPEVNQSKQKICECGHKKFGEHKISFYEKKKDLKRVAQECNVKGCKCKKFKLRKLEVK